MELYVNVIFIYDRKYILNLNKSNIIFKLIYPWLSIRKSFKSF